MLRDRSRFDWLTLNDLSSGELEEFGFLQFDDVPLIRGLDDATSNLADLTWLLAQIVIQENHDGRDKDLRPFLTCYKLDNNSYSNDNINCYHGTMQFYLLTDNIRTKFGRKAQMSYIRYLRRPENLVTLTGTATVSGEIVLEGVTVTNIDETTAILELDRSRLEALADLEALIHFEVDGQLAP